jgi:transposase-like protein
LEGQGEAQSGGELLSALVRLSTERILQEALEQEQTEALGRARYERRAGSQGYRNGYENGTLKTAEGVLRLQVPQISGRPESVRSQLWSGLANTSEVLKT